jgi:hypothetical protein
MLMLIDSREVGYLALGRGIAGVFSAFFDG